jgi:hypothetical protein
VKIYAESIRQLTVDHLELQAKLSAAASITTLPMRRNQEPGIAASRQTALPVAGIHTSWVLPLSGLCLAASLVG